MQTETSEMIKKETVLMKKDNQKNYQEKDKRRKR